MAIGSARFGVAATIALMAPAPPAQAQRESGNLPVHVADQRTLAGSYHFEERDGAELFAVDVRLNADGTALYAVNLGAEGDGIRAEGFWTVRDDVIHIHNRPGPVSLEQAGAPRNDPGVALSVSATLPDGSPAQGLGVTWPGAAGLYMMGDGRYVVRREEGPVAGEVTVERAADGKVLATFAVRPGTSNSYRFTYRPSDAEPFDFAAIALDPRAEVLEVELGTASAELRRVPN